MDDSSEADMVLPEPELLAYDAAERFVASRPRSLGTSISDDEVESGDIDDDGDDDDDDSNDDDDVK